MEQEYPKSDMPEVAEKRPEEADSKQTASIIEAWEEAHKAREKFIGPKLWQQLTDQVNDLNLIRQFDPEGETKEFKAELAKMAKLGEQLRKTEQRAEQVKEGKKFTAIIGKAMAQLGVNKWLDFWNLGFGEMNNIGTEEDFEDLGRFIEIKFSPPIKKLGTNFAYYQVPGSDLIFEVVLNSTSRKVSRIGLRRDRDGGAKGSLERGEQPNYSM